MPNQCFQHLDGPHGGVHLPDDQRVYAIGDIHGRIDLLQALQAIIADDMRETPKKMNSLVYLGDFIDRGPRSADVIEFLSTSKPDGLETVHIRGNHDFFMSGFLDGTGDLANWLMNGGDDTLASYGIDAISDEASPRDALLDAIPEHHKEFLQSLRLSHRIGSLFFAHAGVDPVRPLDDQSAEDLMWIREPFLEWPSPLDAVVVHGHTPRPEPEVRAHRIGVDTLAWRSERLTAVALENGHIRFLST